MKNTKPEDVQGQPAEALFLYRILTLRRASHPTKQDNYLVEYEQTSTLKMAKQVKLTTSPRVLTKN